MAGAERLTVAGGGVLARAQPVPRRLMLGVGAGALLVVAALAWSSAPGGAPTQRALAPPSRSGLTLSMTRHFAISRAQGYGDKRYWARSVGEQFALRNRAQGIAALVGAGGIAVTTREGLHVTLGPVSLGRGRSALAHTSPGGVHASRSEISIPGRELSESLANGPLALEQSFTLSHRPTGDGALVLSQPLQGALSARVEDHGQSVLIRGRAGSLEYSGLAVLDAGGRVLPAHLGVASGALTITIDDRGAAYPLHIDPGLTAPDSTISTPSASTITYGQSATDTLTVTGSSGTPTGNVSFYECGPTGLPVSESSCSSTTNAVGAPATLGGSAGSASATSDPFPASSVGTYCFYAVYVGDGTYQSSSDSTSHGCFKVTRAALTITASNGAFPYGTTAPAITAGYSGLVNGDSAPTTLPSCSTLAGPTSAVGTYFSTCTGASDANYTISYEPGLVNVTPAALTLGVTGSETYGGPASFELDGNNSGFVSPDSTSVLSGSLVGCTSSAHGGSVGGYSSTIGGCTGLSAANYSISYQDDGFTISKAPLTVTASSPSMSYGATVPTITAIYGGLTDGDTPSSLTTQPLCTSSAPGTPTAGGYATSCSGAADPNYAISYAQGTLTVTPAPLLIVASSTSMTYGGTVPTITPIYSGLVDGDLAPASAPTCSTTATATSTAGNIYASNCTGAADPNYAITAVPGTVTVTPAPLTITASSPSMTYGGTAPPISASYSTFVNGQTPSSLAGTLTCQVGATTPYTAGNHLTHCSGVSSTNYAITYVQGALTVTPASLLITASSATMTYGGSVPTITAAYSGLVNSDSAPANAPTCGTATTSSSPVGAYLSSCTGASDPNYAISYAQGAVTVNRAPLTVEVQGSETYGGSQSFSVKKYDGLVNGDATSVVYGSLRDCDSSADGGAVGSYSSTISGCAGLGATNYALSYQDDGFAISKAPLTVTASSPKMTYGGVAPSITPTYSGLVNGDLAPSTTPTCSITGATPYQAGGHVTSCSGAADTNYTISYHAGSLTVARAPLLISASGGTMNYGGTAPSITPIYTGLVNSDAAPAGAPTCSTLASSSSAVGAYASSCAGASDPNYAISYMAGTVTVTPAGLTVEVRGSETYGGSASFNVKQYDGLVNGDGASVVVGTLRDCESSADGGGAGSYPGTISGCAGLGATNYAIGYQDDGFTIGKAPLTVTASSPTMTYGGSAPGVTATYSGLVNGDLAPTVAPTCAIAGTTPYQAGGHVTSCSGAADTNYTISYHAGSLTVAPAPLLISASGGTMTYGGTVPSITPIYTGLVNSDAAPASGPVCGTLASASSAVGAYASSCAGASDPNYAISYMAGTVTVTPAALTITASSSTMTYGGAVPTVTPGYSGWAGSDVGPAALSTLPTCFTNATSYSAVGSSPATLCTGAVDANYTITYVAGTITIDRAALTVTASSPTMTYGGSVPSIVPIYSGFVDNDNASDLPTQPNCTTSASVTAPVATSPSTSCSGPATDGNYTVSYLGGSVTIGRAPLEATINGTQVYGGTDVAYAVANYSGFVNGQGAGVVSGAGSLSCSTSVGADDSVGSYSLTISACTGLSAANYATSYSYGTFSVTPATLTITATPNSGTMTYGGLAPAISPAYSGWAGADTDSNALTTTPTCYTTAGPTSDAGAVLPAICTGALDPNYTIKYVNGTVTVDQAPLTITASSGAMLYGGIVPSITPIYGGFVNNDDPGDLTAEASCVPNATPSSPASTYHPSCSGAVDSNYAITYVHGTLTIGPAPLQITVTGTQVYGSTPSFHIPIGGYSGFVNGESASVLGGSLGGCATTVTISMPAGVYPNTITGCGGLTDTNYAISYLDGGFTVTDAQTSSVSALPLASIAIGGSQVDSVVVTGNVVGGAPTGHVRFYVCAVQTLGVTPCASGGTQVGPDVALTSASADTATASSSALAPDSGPGTYCLRAEYLGDNNYNPSADGTSDECFTVTQGSSSAVASPSAPSAPIGTPVSDTVSVTGNGVAGAPSGPVSFYACAPGTMPCTSGGTSLGQADLVTSGSDTAAATSSSFLGTNGPGTYCFRVVYGGDTNYAGSSDASADQCFSVTKGASSTVSAPGYSVIAAGESDDDSVIVSGNGAGGAPTGSVSFYVCGPGASSCSSTTSQLGATVTLAVSGGESSSASSPYFTPSVAGTYCFYVVYGGNTNYAGSANSISCFTAQAASVVAPGPSSASASVPSNAFQIAGHSFRHDTLHVTLDLPGAGAVALVANHGRNAIASGSGSAAAAGKLKVSLALSSSGVSALTRAISNHKAYKANVTVTFTPTGGSPSTQTLTVTL